MSTFSLELLIHFPARPPPLATFPADIFPLFPEPERHLLLTLLPPQVDWPPGAHAAALLFSQLNQVSPSCCCSPSPPPGCSEQNESERASEASLHVVEMTQMNVRFLKQSKMNGSLSPPPATRRTKSTLINVYSTFAPLSRRDCGRTASSFIAPPPAAPTHHPSNPL